MLDKFFSRRDFLKASAMTAAGGGASMMLAACNNSGGEKNDGGSDKKKVLRFGSTNSKQGLDMQRANNS